MKKKKADKKTTQSELATILGISRQLVAHHMKGGNAPNLDDVDGWLEFLAVNGRSGSFPAEERKSIAKERLRLLRAQAEKAEAENEARRKEVFPAELVQRFCRDVITNVFFGELDKMSQLFPVSLKGKTEIEISQAIEKQIQSIKRTLRDRLDALTKGEI